MILKNFIIYLGGTFTGIFIGIMFIGWLKDKGVTDEDLPSVKIMRLKKGSKSFYVANPKNFGDVVHGLSIIIGWELGLIRKNSIYYENAKISKFAVWLFLSTAISIILISVWWIFRILSTGGHIM